MFEGLIEKWRIKRQFGKFVSPDVIKEILRTDRKIEPPKEGPVEFIFVAAKGGNAGALAENIGKIIDLIVSEGGCVTTILFSSVVIGSFNSDLVPEVPGARVSTVKKLLDRFAGDVKIVHGLKNGGYDFYGSERKLSYGFTFEGDLSSLAILAGLDYGGQRELNETA